MEKDSEKAKLKWLKENSEKAKQQYFNQQVYDRLKSKNLHSTAEAFAKEANFQPLKPGEQLFDDAFLSNFWSMFKDIHCSRPGYIPTGNQASASTPNARPALLAPTAASPSTGRPKQHQAVDLTRLPLNPTTVPPNIHRMEQVNNRQQCPAASRAFKSQHSFRYKESYVRDTSADSG